MQRQLTRESKKAAGWGRIRPSTRTAQAPSGTPSAPESGHGTRSRTGRRCEVQRPPRHPSSSARRRAAFTLIEINLALLLIIGAVVSLLGLVTVSMQQRMEASSDAAQTAFAAMVLNAIRANAQAVTNWSEWQTLTNGIELGVASGSPNDRKITVPTVLTPSGVTILGDGGTHEIGNAASDGYLTKGQYLKYELHIENESAGDLDLNRKIWLRASARRYVPLDNEPVFLTSITYMGM